MNDDPDQSLTVRNLQRSYKVDRVVLERFMAEVASTLGAGDASATLALVGDARIQKLNCDFRGHDKPTDVLSFVAEQTDYLGDIVVSVDTASRQAKRRGSNLERELKVLGLHGFLHLLGYDHEKDHGEMRRIEYRLRRRFAITTPRAARV
jgi:probable rRNA maturation factor